MSRLAKKPIIVPPKTEVSVSEREVRVKGPKGVLTRPAHRLVSIAVGAEGVVVKPTSDSLQARALLGTYVSHIRNMLEGVTSGFTKKLFIEGVGYKWEVQPARPDDPGHSGGGKVLNLSLGFSHPVKLAIPEGLTVTPDKGILTIAGFDKELVGLFAAKVRAQKPPEPYKGKGIRYEGEVVRRKQGKKAI